MHNHYALVIHGVRMARTTISIPDDLKRRMDRVKEPVNWSAIAAEAFELKLGEIARKQKEKTMDTVIARLRASKIQGASAFQKEGHVIGIGWAKEHAEFDELQRLARLDADEFFGSDWGGDGAYAAAEVLVFKIAGTDDYDRSAATDFWESLLGDDADAETRLASLDFLRGFVEGAVELFEQVEGEL